LIQIRDNLSVLTQFTYCMLDDQIEFLMAQTYRLRRLAARCLDAASCREIEEIADEIVVRVRMLAELRGIDAE